mmetsp:Transcript_31840/g.76040  ORF Transcript_31840/g.76040 Transcript_31840/m.76040 type:complete len:155 (+) Transcript_31840:97-561(+)
MNTAFREAAAMARQKPVDLTHNQQVARLYRKALKTLCSWTIDREIFIDEAIALRSRFDAERGCSNAKAVRLLKEAKTELYEFTHPDPYCVPYMPGGTLFMRNPPLPMEIVFPDGDIPADAPRHTLNPDMTICEAETGKSAVGSVLVDFTKKNME